MSELVAILGQSQPRVSRHLKLLVEAGLATASARAPGPSSVSPNAAATLAREWLRRLDPADPSSNADRARLEVARETRRKQAASYFAERAADWDQIRALHAPEERVEAALVAMIGDKPFRNLLDLGTGTGRMLELLAPRARAPSASTRARRCWRSRAPASIRRAFATSRCARATSTRRRSNATPTISSSSTRCCTSSTIRPGR